jgi:hypothetical protein
VLARVRPLLAATVACAGLALAGCGSSGGTSCDGEVCTVESDGPGTYTLDQQSTQVELSDLRPDTVRVRINSEQQTVTRGADPVRIRGFLVSATQTSTDHAEVRIER